MRPSARGQARNSTLRYDHLWRCDNRRLFPDWPLRRDPRKGRDRRLLHALQPLDKPKPLNLEDCVSLVNHSKCRGIDLAQRRLWYGTPSMVMSSWMVTWSAAALLSIWPRARASIVRSAQRSVTWFSPRIVAWDGSRCEAIAVASLLRMISVPLSRRVRPAVPI